MSHDSLTSISKRKLGEMVKEQFANSFRKLRASRETEDDVKKK